MTNSKVRPKDAKAGEVSAEICSELRMAALQAQTRRHFLRTLGSGLGTLFVGTSLAQYAKPGKESARSESSALDFTRDPSSPLSQLPPQFAAKVRRVIYLHMAGAPSQLELFEHKPDLKRLDGEDCPASFLAGKRFAFISGVPKLLGSQYPFHQVGESGHWISDRLPHLEQHLDDICLHQVDAYGSVQSRAGAVVGAHRECAAWIPLVRFLGAVRARHRKSELARIYCTCSRGANRLTVASNYGVPASCRVFTKECNAAPMASRSCISITLQEQAVRCGADMLDAIDKINQQTYAAFGNPETITRIAQYEMAFRMQMDATDAMDIHKEPDSVRARYGSKPGESSFANNCLVARRLAERGVRFIQLYHWGWDSHGADAKEALNLGFADRCREVDQPTAALLADLKERGMLEDTLVVWGGEFGRTPMRENRNGQEMKYVGRDHNPGAFTIWLAGGGVKPGITHGQTDEMGYEIVKDPVEIRDLHATMLYLLGFDHHKLNYSFQGLEQKLTSVKPARVVSEILA